MWICQIRNEVFLNPIIHFYILNILYILYIIFYIFLYLYIKYYMNIGNNACAHLK